MNHSNLEKATLKVGMTVLGVILASDKMHPMNFSGDKAMHAVCMSLGNIHKVVQRKLSSKAWLLVEKISDTKFQGSKSERKAMPGILHQCLFHECMGIALKPTCLNT